MASSKDVREALQTLRNRIGNPREEMSDDADKKATIFYQTGDKALGRSDYDYALECFGNCCRLVPSKLIYRQALRITQQKKHGNNGKGVSMASMRMKPARMKMSVSKQRGKWKDVVDSAEEALALNPWDTQTLLDQSLALHELGHLDVAIWVLETARDNKTGEVYRNLAKFYEEAEQFQKAIKTWESVSKIDPSDENALAKIRQLSAAETIQKGKFDNDSEEDGNNQGQSRAAAPETYEARLAREIKELVTRIEEDPKNVVNYRDLGETYRRLGDIEKAVDAFKRGFEASGRTDPDMNLRLKEVEVEPYRRKLSDLEHKKTVIDPKKDPENAQKVRDLIRACTAKILKLESEVYRLRIQLNGDDFSSYYELGYRSLRLGDLDEAIKALQKGRNDVQRKWQAMLYLGVAFWQKKNYALAEKNLSDATDSVPSGNEEGRKEILYYRGRVAQDSNDTPRALAYFNDIAAVDYEYKDVAKRIDEITAAGG